MRPGLLKHYPILCRVNKVFKGKDLTKVKSHTINYGHIVDNGNIVDEVSVTVKENVKKANMLDYMIKNLKFASKVINMIKSLENKVLYRKYNLKMV